jgi:tryptophan-rich sensory protein
MFWVVLIASLLTGADLWRRSSKTELQFDAPEWAPSLATAQKATLATFTAAVLGILLAVNTGERAGLIGGLWLGSLALTFGWARMLLTPRLSAAFTMHNVTWVGYFLAAGAAWASSSVAGYLALPLLIWLVFLGGVTFFVWQMNQPSQRR